MYGLEHESLKDTPFERREEVTREVFRLFDLDHNGVIERSEWLVQCNKGVVLPDFAVCCSCSATSEPIQDSMRD